MSLNISYIIISLIFIALIIEDFKTKYIDIRLCVLLFISVIFNVYVNENISLLEYFSNSVYGLFFMLFIYILCLKVLKIESNIDINNDIENNVVALGFIPSFSMAFLIYYFNKNNIIISQLINDSALFLSNLGVYIAIILLSYMVLKLIYIFYLKTKKEALIIAGFGDGDVIVLTILIGIIGLNVFIFIFTIALIVHVLSYVIYFLRKE
ncbi:hypothetical protein INF25_11720 [Megamonas funiformis]|nr:hypothetical protein [Megamonas funiformis]